MDLALLQLEGRTQVKGMGIHRPGGRNISNKLDKEQASAAGRRGHGQVGPRLCGEGRVQVLFCVWLEALRGLKWNKWS